MDETKLSDIKMSAILLSLFRLFSLLVGDADNVGTNGNIVISPIINEQRKITPNFPGYMYQLEKRK